MIDRDADGNIPYLTVVATTRNDDHGGDLLYRMQLFVDALVAECERHGLDAELVLVEWNPPEDRLRLADALSLPVSRACPIRIVEVPNALHSRLDHSDRLPLFQMIAKNVGIRRARGEFILATNVDVLLSDKLVGFLAKRRLERNRVYRCDRYDVTADIPLGIPVEEQLRLCGARVIRINRLEGTLHLRDGSFDQIYRRRAQLPWWFALALHTIGFAWRRLKRVMRRVATIGLRPTKRLSRIPQPRSLEPEGSFADRRRERLARYRRHVGEIRDAWAWERARVRLHTNASGDFTLMSREGWASVQGYAQLELFSMHIDGLLLYQAHYAGIREHRLPYRVYHLEHASGFMQAAIPQVTETQFMGWAVEMFHERKPILFNDKDWGLANETLTEFESSSRLEIAGTAARG